MRSSRHKIDFRKKLLSILGAVPDGCYNGPCSTVYHKKKNVPMKEIFDSHELSNTRKSSSVYKHKDNINVKI